MVVNQTHSFKGSIIMYGLIMLEIPTLILIIVLWLTDHLGDDGPWIVLLVAATIVFMFALLMNIQLEIRITDKGITYRNPPFINKWRIIKKEEIVSFQIKKSDGMLEYGGIGIRYSRKRTGYIYFTDYVLEVILPKRKLVFSIENTMDLQHILNEWTEITDRNHSESKLG